MKTHSETVSFRADNDLLKQIDAECVEFGVSRGSWVRGVVLAHFHRREMAVTKDDLDEFVRQLDALTSKVDSLQPDIAQSLFFVLTKVGAMPADQAKELVRSKFLARGD